VNSSLELLTALRAAPDLMLAVSEMSGKELAVQKELRQRFDAELVIAALALHNCRQKAKGILPKPHELWLTTTSLEQCTHPIVAAHKAQRFPQDVPVLDLCSGLGSDTAALSTRGPVTSIDIDAAMLQRCEWNLAAWNCDWVRFQQADVASAEVDGKWLHVDPDRRNGRPRPTKRLEQYTPDLGWMQGVTRTAAGGAIKIGPASNFMQKFPGCEIELISLQGECREATVWFGELAEQEQFRATILPSGETIAGAPLDAWADSANEPLQYVLDPNPAVVRSGLIDAVCAQHSLQRLDPEEEYLTADQIPSTDFVSAFEVEAVLPNNVKQLSRHLRQSPGRYYEIKCRRLPIDAAATAKKLPTGGEDPKVIIFLRVQGKARIVVANRL